MLTLHRSARPRQFSSLDNKQSHEILVLHKTARAHLFKIVSAAKVLGDGHAVLKVKNGVPPTPRNEYRFTRVLYELVHLDRATVLASYPRQDVDEVVDLQ